MTKIKNTKKGMAKKTLSISLAVAMLATSNVPVWAAEFTDGTDAAFTSEAPVEVVDEAPVVEEETDLPAARVEGSVFDVTFKNFKDSMEWGKTYSDFGVKISGLDADKTQFKARWVDANGNASTDYSDGWIGLSLNENGEDTTSIKPKFLAKDVGKTFRVQIGELKGNGVVEVYAVSDPIQVAKKTIRGTASFEVTPENAIRYTGKQIGLSREAISNAVSGVNFTELNGDVLNDGTLDEPLSTNNADSLNMGTWVATGDKPEDTIDASYPGKMVDVTATTDISNKYYAGKVTGTFNIWRKSFDKIDDAVKAELNTGYVYEYTGTDITVKGSDITITNKVTESAVANAAKDTTFSGKALSNDVDVKIPVDMKEGSLENLAKKDSDFTDADKATPASKVSVVARDLNGSNTKITATKVTKDELGRRADGTFYIDAAAFRDNNLFIQDAYGTKVWGGVPSSEFKNHITVKFASGSSMDIKPGQTNYEAIIEGDGTYVKGTVKVPFSVVAHDLAKANFEHENFIASKTFFYTGEQITLGLTGENIQADSKLGKLMHPEFAKPLQPGDDYDVTLKFGENKNVGTATITLVGKNSFAGSEKVITFEINPRQIDASDIVVPKKTLYNSAFHHADEYDFATSITVKGTDVATGKKYDLTVPAEDYKVEKEFTNATEGNEVGNTIETLVTRTNKNSNFVFVENKTAAVQTTSKERLKAKDTTEIVNRAITDADVILEKTEYTYTGAQIVPEYKVIVGGETLVKGVDYTEQVTEGKNVGEGTLVITGMGDFDDESVSKKFTIVAADISTLTVEAGSGVVYDGERWIGKRATEKLVFKLGKNVIDESELAATYPTTKTANLNAGNGTVSLKPARGNKNFVGGKEFTFTIAPAKITANQGILSAFDKNGSKVDMSDDVDFNGTAHTFDRVTYAFDPATYFNNSKMKFTADDYDIIYRDNIVGKADSKGSYKQYGHVLVVAKGNYAGVESKDYTCADGEVIKNVIYNQAFQINQINITYNDHVSTTIENGEYAEGKNVDPVVTITYKGKKLVEGVDYELDYSRYAHNQDRTKVTNGKTLRVDIKGIGGYVGEIWDKAWGIDKFDLANAETVVKGTDAEPIVKLLNKGVVIDPSEYDLVAKDGKATATAKKDSKNYTGEITFDIKEALVKPETPVITDVQVSGNKAKVILSGECEGADGYDYVISKNRNCIVDKDYAKVNKNKLNTDTTFQYIEPQGMYYAYCHAWTRNPETGKKEFSEWSEPYAFSVTAITPSQPVVTSVKVSGSTVTVTYTQSANAQGYDVVLGSRVATVLDEKRPVDYGTLVKKNVSGNTVKVTFKNVKKGTYYAGLHAFNRSASEDNKKVFSPWSNTKKVVVK